MSFDPVQLPGYVLWQTAHALDRSLNAALAEFGISLLQFGSLVHIVNEPGISSAEVARRTTLTPQSVQTSLKPLIESGLIERRPHPVHGRVLGIYALEPAVELVAKAGPAIDEVESRLVAGFTDAEKESLHGALMRTLENLNPIALDRSSVRAGE